MSEAIAAGVGGLLGALLGSYSGVAITQKPDGTVVVQVLPYRFLRAGFIEVGTVPRQITTIPTLAAAVLLKADRTNSAAIWVGGASVSPERGVPLYPADVISMNIMNLHDMYVVSSAESQKLYYLILGGVE